MNCPFCKKELTKIQIDEITIKVVCEHCGRYSVTSTNSKMKEENNKDK